MPETLLCAENVELMETDQLGDYRLTGLPAVAGLSILGIVVVSEVISCDIEGGLGGKCAESQ